MTLNRLPSWAATTWLDCLLDARAVLLSEPESRCPFGSITSRGCWFGHVEAADTLFNLFHNLQFWFLESQLQVWWPSKWSFGGEQVPKWKHVSGRSKAKLICPTHPNHELMSVILRVVGRSRIDWMNSGVCWMWENFRGPGSHAGYICVEYTRIGQNQVRFNIFI